MKIKSLISLICLVVVMSCRRGESSPPSAPDALIGTWQLYLVFGGNYLGGSLPPKIAAGTFLSFHSDGTYTVTNPSNQSFGVTKSPGTFIFSFKNTPYTPHDALVGIILFKKDSLYHDTYIQKDTLILDYNQPALDGVAFKFIKVK